MMRKKVIGIVSTLLLLLITLTGCSGDETTSTDTESQTNPTSQTEKIEANDDFSYSDELTDKGYWSGIEALDHVTLCDYRSIVIPETVSKVTDEVVNAEIDKILQSHQSETQIKNRAVKHGDTVLIDYAGSIGGKPFEGGSTDGQGTRVTIGESQFIDDFLEQLIGHQPDETFTITVTFPEDYGSEELDGKEAEFEITIHAIIEMEKPQWTDTFVSEQLSSDNGWTTTNEAESAIRKEIQSVSIRQYIESYLVEESDIKSLPESLIAYKQQSTIAFYQAYAEQYGMDFDSFMETFLDVSSVDVLMENHHDEHVASAQFFLVAQAVAEDADITIDEAAVAHYFKENMQISDYSEYESVYGLPYLKLITLHQEIIDMILAG